MLCTMNYLAHDLSHISHKKIYKIYCDEAKYAAINTTNARVKLVGTHQDLVNQLVGLLRILLLARRTTEQCLRLTQNRMRKISAK